MPVKSRSFYRFGSRNWKIVIFAIIMSLFYRLYNNDKKFSDTYPLDQNFRGIRWCNSFFDWKPSSCCKMRFIIGQLRHRFFLRCPSKNRFFTPKERGPIKKRVAPSDFSKNFGVGGMCPKFLYRYCIACKIKIFWPSWYKNLKSHWFWC